jgi:hypothetical protein
MFFLIDLSVMYEVNFGGWKKLLSIHTLVGAKERFRILG